MSREACKPSGVEDTQVSEAASCYEFTSQFSFNLSKLFLNKYIHPTLQDYFARGLNKMPNHPVVVSGAIVVISVAVAVSLPLDNHSSANRIQGRNRRL